ncbi:C-type lectin BpLec-like [Asterias amurensis]|uniref:C-type lectin BpLec-like n=1 Tax=Asterias amurensis TaxID=7602 RepID=UPI003AB742CA
MNFSVSMLVFVGLAATVSAGCSGGPSCPDDYASWEGSCYKLYVEALTWQAAENRCLEDGAHLTSIHSASEDAFTNDLSQSISDPDVGKHTWIGMNDLGTEGVYEWTDGSAADYFNWHSGEPNNHKTGENCLEINFFDVDGTWNDHFCDQTHRFICKMAPSFPQFRQP